MGYNVEQINHGSNIGIDIVADSISDLFRGCALAMLEIMVDNSEIESHSVRMVSANADSLDLLLIDFLYEILDLILIDGFAVLDVQIGEISDGFVVAEATGQKDLPITALPVEIKGVTYNRVAIEKTDFGQFKTSLIFNL